IDDAALASLDACARILSPRRLREHKRYTAFLVPVFRRGLRAGLAAPTEEITDRADELAWDSKSTASEPIELPYYDRFAFFAGAAHDFAAAVKRLRRPVAPSDAPNIGSTQFDARGLYVALNEPSTAAGLNLQSVAATANSLRQWGLLVPVGTKVSTWPD